VNTAGRADKKTAEVVPTSYTSYKEAADKVLSFLGYCQVFSFLSRSVIPGV